MMAIEISEAFESGRLRASLGRGSSYEEAWNIKGATSRIEALDALAGVLSTRRYVDVGAARLILDYIETEPVSDESGGRYRGRAYWKDEETAAQGGNSPSPSGGSGTWPSPGTGNGLDDPDTYVNGTQLDVVTDTEQQFWSPAGKYSFYGDPSVAVDLAGAIDFDGESIKGLQRIVPKPTWSEEFRRGQGWFSPARLVGMSGYVGVVNSEAYQGFPAGTLLVLSISGAFKTADEFVYRATYAYSPNQENLTYGVGSSAFVVPSKKGWEYLWIRYEKELQTDTGLVIPKPIAAYVHEVYLKRDLAGIKDL